MTTWASDDAKRARRKVVRHATKAYVIGLSHDTVHHVHVTKAEAYRLIDTGHFIVMGGDDAPAYLQALPKGNTKG